MQNRKNFSIVKAHVFNCLRVGKRNAVSRKEIVIRTGYNDRIVREAIEGLRHSYPIIGLDNGSGYYIAEKTAQGAVEASQWIKRQTNRAKAIKASTRGAGRFVREMKNIIPGQINIYGEEEG